MRVAAGASIAGIAGLAGPLGPARSLGTCRQRRPLPSPSPIPHPLTPPQLWDRGTDKWTHIPTTINSICGGWAKFANGDVGLFAGAR